jgi:hypothetical protein
MDPKAAIIALLGGHWALDFRPLITGEWYDGREESPQVTVSHLATRPEPLGLSDESPAPRRFRATYAVDVWCRGDQARRYAMAHEVDRVLHGYAPEGVEWADVSDWADMDEAGDPPLYRSRVRAGVIWYG